MCVCVGAVLPVGGVLLAESIIEPLSGRMVRIGGASIRAGQLLPNAGGYQALLDCKVLSNISNDNVLFNLRMLVYLWKHDTHTINKNDKTKFLLLKVFVAL